MNEIELKYDASKISLNKFIAACESQNPSLVITVSGFDHFYKNIKDKNSFCRHRVGNDMNQLTFKRKTEKSNNYIRIEHNIDLQKVVSRAAIEALMSEFHHTYAGSIFKTAFIYKFEDHILVYYICYNSNMKELGRLIEIEIDEEKSTHDPDWAWGRLLSLEDKLSNKLGISEKTRIKKSLFEMYTK